VNLRFSFPRSSKFKLLMPSVASVSEEAVATELKSLNLLCNVFS
jgi:hypothetical protein